MVGVFTDYEVLRKNLRARYSWLEKLPGTPSHLDDYLSQAQPVDVEERPGLKEFREAIIKDPALYCPRLTVVPKEIMTPYCDVPLRVSSARPAPPNIDLALSFKSRYRDHLEPRLYLFSIIPHDLSDDPAAERHLRVAGLFFYTHFNVWSKMWTLKGSPDCFHRQEVPYKYFRCFQGLFRDVNP